MSPSSSPAPRTIIASAVIESIVGTAARSVPGVHTLGGSVGTLGRVRQALPAGGASTSSGVQVELGELQAAVDLSLVVEYGVPIPRLAEEVREQVITAVETLAGFEVTEVNVAVLDVHLDDEEQQ